MKKLHYIAPLFSFSLSCNVPPPPILKQYESNTCWNNSALQLIRNIGSITSKLLADKRSKKERLYYGKGDALTDAYIDFLEASFKDEEAVNTAAKKLYGTICTQLEIKQGGPGIPERTVDVLRFNKLLSSLFKDAFDMTFTHYNSRTKQETPNFTLNMPHSELDFENQIKHMIERGRIDELKLLPGYVLLDPMGNKKLVSYDFHKFYELIGIVDAWAEGGHYWSYVKDQFNEIFPWYKRNDIRPNEDQQALEKLPENFENLQLKLYKRKYPDFERFLKKIEASLQTKQAVQKLAEAFHDIAIL